MNDLTDKWHKVATKLYQSTGQSSGTSNQQNASSNKKDDVVDADYEVVDEDKKENKN